MRIPAEKLDLAGFRMFTFGTFSSGRAGIMRDQTSVLTDFSGNSGRGTVQFPGYNRETAVHFQHGFDTDTIGKSKMFHKDLQSDSGTRYFHDTRLQE